MSVDRPILFLDESLDIALALDDKAQGNRLYAAGGESAADLVPQQRRNLIAHQAVKHAAGLLRVHQIAVNIVRMLECFLYRALGNFVKGDAADVDRAALLFLAVNAIAAKLFGEVSRDSFSLAVRVRRQVDGVRRLRQLLQSGNDLFLARDNHVLGREVVLEIDPE